MPSSSDTETGTSDGEPFLDSSSDGGDGPEFPTCHDVCFGSAVGPIVRTPPCRRPVAFYFKFSGRFWINFGCVGHFEGTSYLIRFVSFGLL